MLSWSPAPSCDYRPCVLAGVRGEEEGGGALAEGKSSKAAGGTSSHVAQGSCEDRISVAGEITVAQA